MGVETRFVRSRGFKSGHERNQEGFMVPDSDGLVELDGKSCSPCFTPFCSLWPRPGSTPSAR